MSNRARAWVEHAISIFLLPGSCLIRPKNRPKDSVAEDLMPTLSARCELFCNRRALLTEYALHQYVRKGKFDPRSDSNVLVYDLKTRALLKSDFLSTRWTKDSWFHRVRFRYYR